MDSPTIPRVSGDELRVELEAVLTRHFGRRRRIRSLRRRRSNYSSSSNIENLEIELDHGKHLSLVFKDLSPASLLEHARDVRPRFLYEPRRELCVYGTILKSRRFGTPLCYGSVQCPERERFWIFLERVRGPLLWQVGRMELWKSAAAWLAVFHTAFPSDKEVHRLSGQAHLLCHDHGYLAGWAVRAENHLSRQRGRRPQGLTRRFQKLVRNYEKVIGKLDSLPRTLIHGEFYPSNVLLRDHGRTNEVCPIDWELASVGSGLMDLAALTAGRWTREQKAALVLAYREALVPVGSWPPPMDELLGLMDFCHLHLSVQWLGWASDWSPPSSHAQDWLSEALQLAARLKL